MTAALATQPNPFNPTIFDLSDQTWELMTKQANTLVKSGFLPQAVNTPEKALAIMFKGRELGIPPMQAFSHVHIISGKPCISAELMLALIFRNCPGVKIEYAKLDQTGCTIKATRPGLAPATFKFDDQDAAAAELNGKDNWKKWRPAMHRSRAISIMGRSLFPDCIMGCSYTPEEMSPDSPLSEEGQVIDIEVARGGTAASTAPKAASVTPAAETVAAPPPAAQDDSSKRTSKKSVGNGAEVASIYNGETGQQRIVEQILTKQKVPSHFWDDIHKRLMGRVSTDLKKVINEVMGEAHKTAFSGGK